MSVTEGDLGVTIADYCRRVEARAAEKPEAWEAEYLRSRLFAMRKCINDALRALPPGTVSNPRRDDHDPHDGDLAEGLDAAARKDRWDTVPFSGKRFVWEPPSGPVKIVAWGDVDVSPPSGPAPVGNPQDQSS